MFGRPIAMAEEHPTDSSNPSPSKGSVEPRLEDPSGGAPASREATTANATSALLPKIVPFGELARCGEELWIEHAGQLYRLRQTKSGKLILTK